MKKIIKKTLDYAVRAAGQRGAAPIPAVAQVLRPARRLGPPPPPCNAADLPPALQAWFRDATDLPAQVVYRFQEGARASWNGVVVRGLRVFAASLARPDYVEEVSGTYLLRQWKGSAIKLDGPAGLVYDNWAANNYYHWLIDSLPRLLLLRAVQPACPVLVPAPVRSYMVDSIRALGFEVVQPVPFGRFAQPRQLLLPAHITTLGKQDPDLMQQLRTQLLTAFGHAVAPAPAAGRWVYVSRSKQPFRRLANEAALLALCARLNIEVMYLEGTSFEQQIAQLQGVRVLLGVHGANLANMLFLGEGASVVELFSEHVRNPCYYHLASSLHLRYYAVPCTAQAGSGDSQTPNSEDLVVEINFLQQVLTYITNA